VLLAGEQRLGEAIEALAPGLGAFATPRAQVDDALEPVLP